MKIKLLELFSGTGGFTKGFLDAGYEIEKHWFSEIDKHAIANYKYNFKNAEYVGSVTDVRGTGINADVITFGSPCQDFSLAGKRAGMEGKRSSLILEAIRLISEIKPSVFIWENVKGAFSSNDGADFWAILAAFANIGGYRLEWQLLNTSWFLPQNRERIYLIGHLAGRSEPGVFPIGESDFKNSGNGFGLQKQIAQTLTTAESKIGRGMNCIQVKSNTSKGYEELKPGDSLNFSVPTSKTRRGRVGKLQAQTLDTQCNQGVIAGAIRGRGEENKQELELRKDGKTNSITSVQKDNVIATEKYFQYDVSGKGYKSQQDRAYYSHKDGPCLSSSNGGDKHKVLTDGFKIRRLTEIECERLQGFPDSWSKYGIYDGKVKEVPKTQRYKMMGNAVTVRVVEEIAKRLKL